MIRRYAAFMAVPICLAVLVAAQWTVALARGPRPAIGFAFRGPQRESRLIGDAARASGAARLEARAIGEALSRPGLVAWDEAIAASREPLPPGGSPYRELEDLKDIAWAGSSLLFGYRALSGTSTGPALDELAETCGISPSGWIGAYLRGAEKAGIVPETARRAWEARNGQPWRFRGDILLFWNREEGKVLVLRRGVELGPGALLVRGAAPGGAEGRFAGWFIVARPIEGSTIAAEFVPDLLGPGAEILSRGGLPSSFPALCRRSYGRGEVWAMTGDFAGTGTSSEYIGPLPAPRLERSRTLDSPGNSIAHFQRILVPLFAEIAEGAPKASDAAPSAPAAAEIRVRARGRALERSYPAAARGGTADWKPWFVRGVDVGASAPGFSATEPRTDDGYWMENFARIADAGFDSIRVYTLLPPAFYRALARFDSRAPRPLYLFQGIWLDEDPPGGDLLDPRWLASAMDESDRCQDAVHGRASVAPRTGKSWGEYRVDASPWLAAFLVGRELLPEEVAATAKAHPAYRWRGAHYAASADHPVESFLASWADRIQVREAERYGGVFPIGFVSWPTLDPLHHPGEWDQGSEKAPYHDSQTLDLRAIGLGPDESSGFFAAFHIYPNYPDFMTRDSRYASDDPTGMGRYGAYLSDLASVLPRVPLVVAEFGLATGFGEAHAHPEGLSHGGLTEEAQAAGLSRMLRTIAARGASGGMVFEWSDEWSKKTWTTEPYMIPYGRHPLWHNAVDPEQNYGIVGWRRPAQPEWSDSGAGIRTAMDEEYLYISLEPARGGRSGPRVLEVGIDTVPEAGQHRLFEGGPRSSMGFEFKVWAKLSGAGLAAARLLVAADYDRDSGKLLPRDAEGSAFTEISSLINREITSEEGIHFPAQREDGSALRLDSGSREGLAGIDGSGRLVLRLPWSRLNVSDPSSGTILLDGRDTRPIAAQDRIRTARIGSVGIWAVERSDEDGGEPPRVLRSLGPCRAKIAGWESVRVVQRPKEALGVLSRLLHSWNTPGSADAPR